MTIITPEKTLYEDNYGEYNIQPLLGVSGYRCFTVSGVETSGGRSFVIKIANYIATPHNRYHRRITETKVVYISLSEVILESTNLIKPLPPGEVVNATLELMKSRETDISKFLESRLGCYFDSIIVI